MCRPFLSSFVWFLAAAVASAQGFNTPGYNNSCGTCYHGLDNFQGGWWTSTSLITTSIEAATVVIISNNRTNTTRTTTIWNLPPNATLPATNSAGYVVHTKTITWGSNTTTTVLTWPTGYIAYQEGISWQGVIPVTSAIGSLNSSTASCLTATSTAFSAYPSILPPSFPSSTMSDISAPPYQTESFYLWSWVDTDSGENALQCEGPWSLLDYASIYTNFAPYKYCTSEVAPCAATALGTAAYLTVTSTSHEDTGPTSTSAGSTDKSASAVPSPQAENSPSPAAAGSKSPAPTQTSSSAGAAGIGGAIASILASSKGSTKQGASATAGSGNGGSGSNGGPNTNSGSSDNDNSGSHSSNEPGGSGSESPSTLQLTTKAGGQTIAVASSATTIPLASITGQQGGSDSSDDSNGAPTAPFTYTSGTVSTVVTPTTDSRGDTVIVLSSSAAAFSVKTNSAGQPVIVSDISTTIPLSAIPGAPTGSGSATQPFTYVSGTISTVVTPTTNRAGQPVVVLSSSVTLPLESVTGSAGASGSVGGYIISGLGGTAGSVTGTAGSPGGSATGSSSAQVTTNAGSARSTNLCAGVIVAFALCVLIL